MIFAKFAKRISDLSGSPIVFSVAVLMVLGWLLSGPFFNYSTAWSLAMNSVTTIVTTLMVFLIQASQNQEMRAIHAKLDALILGHEGADNQIVGVNHQSIEELDKLLERLEQLAEEDNVVLEEGQR